MADDNPERKPRKRRGVKVSDRDIYVLILALFIQGMYETLKELLSADLPWIPSIDIPAVSTTLLVVFLLYLMRRPRKDE